MQIIIKGKQMEVTPRLRDLVEKKVQRLARFVDVDARVDVTVAEEQTRSARDRYSVQLALSGTSHPIRSEMRAVSANMALDLVLDKVIIQLGRQKDRQTSTLRHRTPAMKVLSLSRAGLLSEVEEEQVGLDGQSDKQDGAYSEEQLAAAIAQDQNEEIWSKVLEIRRVPTKPMDDQEVIAQMIALDLSFLPFFNEATNSVNVMYRLSKGGYGLLVPELD